MVKKDVCCLCKKENGKLENVGNGFFICADCKRLLRR